jgi:hypothetical protein
VSRWPLNSKLIQIILKHSVPTAKKTQRVSNPISWLIPFQEILAIYSENHKVKSLPVPPCRQQEALDVVSGQCHSKAALLPRGKDPFIHWIGEGLRAGLDTEAIG